MAKLYLLTGFLGAGKTTCLNQLATCFPGSQLAIVVNEFGKEGVDAALLAAQGYAFEEINNGSIFCACRSEQFREALEAVLARTPDVILVEASGLADPSNIRGILAAPSLGAIDYMGSICLLDAKRFHKVVNTALVARNQLSHADGVIINKTDLATKAEIAAIHGFIDDLCPGAPVLCTSFGKVDAQWVAQLPPNRQSAYDKLPAHAKDITLQRLSLALTPGVSQGDLEGLLSGFLHQTYRVKGFVTLTQGTMLVNCVGDDISITPWSGDTIALNTLTVLYGHGLKAKSTLKQALQGYPIGKIVVN